MKKELLVVVLGQTLKNLHSTMVGQSRSKLHILDMCAEKQKISIDLIIDQLSISRVSASTLTTRMVNDGLLTKEIEGDSKRVVTIRMTEAGEKILAATAEARQSYEEVADNAISAVFP